MERKEYQIKKILPGISLLYGFREECCIYVVEGDDSVAMIDTGMGTGDLRKALDAVAPGKKVLVFNTHCHFDHSAGDFQFPEVRMHPACYADQDETETMTCPREAEYPDLPRYATRRIPVKEGDVFDLGGVTLEIIETPGHTPGCICLLDRRHRVLFAGDLIGSNAHNVWMLDHLPWMKFSTVSLECYLRSLRKISARANAFDGFLAGHDACVLGKEYLEELIRLTASIIDGTAVPYHPDMPSPPGMDPIVCWKVDGETVPTALLYQDESIFDRAPENGDGAKRSVTAIAEGVTLLKGIDFECCIWLVEGRDSALLIDTGIGVGDLRSEVEALLNGKPYQVVNTHGHGDHSGGNYQFDTVYMHRAAQPTAAEALEMTAVFASRQELAAIKERMKEHPTELRFVSEGDVFDLGGRSLEVFETPGHTPGDLTLFDRENGLLFSGDCMLKAMNVLLIVPQALSVACYAESVRKLAALEGVEGFCSGHDQCVMPRSFLLDCAACAEEILAGTADAQEARPEFPGIDTCLRAVHGDAAILYLPEKLH